MSPLHYVHLETARGVNYADGRTPWMASEPATGADREPASGGAVRGGASAGALYQMPRPCALVYASIIKKAWARAERTMLVVTTRGWGQIGRSARGGSSTCV
jgi:hypothetical protein